MAMKSVKKVLAEAILIQLQAYNHEFVYFFAYFKTGVEMSQRDEIGQKSSS